MFEPIYVCRATFCRHGFGKPVDVIPASTGIVKVAGCFYFAPATKRGKYFGWCQYGERGSVLESISLAECRKRYSSIPKPGEAWLVQERRDYIRWDREDQNLFLLNEDGSLCKEGHDAG